jgi:hypothetical protein
VSANDFDAPIFVLKCGTLTEPDLVLGSQEQKTAGIHDGSGRGFFLWASR